MKKIDGIIEVEEIFDVIDIGVTVPVKCRLVNGMDVVVKYMKNPFGTQVLINELIGSHIADMMDITIPEYGICSLTEEIIGNTNSNDEISEENAGIGFFTKLYSKTIPIQRNILSMIENKETEKIILFDHIVNNKDRHMGNLLCDISRGATLYSIDNSHILAKELVADMDTICDEMSLEKAFSMEILESNGDVYNLLCKWVAYSEKTMREEAEKIFKALGNDKINLIKKSIPEVWIKDFGSGKIDTLLNLVQRRAEHIEDICEMIIDKRRTL